MKPRCFIIIAIIVIAVAAALYVVLKQPAIAPAENPVNSPGDDESALTVDEALVIAKNSDCAKSGEVQAESFYNPNSQTWWFTLKADKAGCNPACVVAADGSAEVNWRCTGLIVPEAQAGEIIRQLLAAKYPKYATTLSVAVSQETADHARGTVIFAAGEAGGIFLGAKVDGQWQVVYDGNGAIPCSLAKYGFPTEMLSDCAK